MRLFLFSASVFYLLGLKLTSHLEIRTHLVHKSETIEPKTTPDTKQNVQPQGIKPELTSKDTTISIEIKKGQLTTPCSKNTKKQSAPSHSGKANV
jgi:hypothetical protein